jgi:2-polyprenyl-3-methyl-5-hydroxy-6-metoxy-1,4-benzoquinol methylase
MKLKAAITKACYFSEALGAWISGKGNACPSCGSISHNIIDRKWLVTTLRRCPKCKLLHRAPCTPKEKQREFYQKTYEQGFTTDMPLDDELARLVEREFRNTPRDYTGYINLLWSLGVQRGAHILEFGCSWGYGAWQLMKAGFEIAAYEISQPRCQYARDKLGIRAHENLASIKEKYDVVFSAHVLEHVDSVESSISAQLERLRPEGLLVAITPNGSSVYRKTRPNDFHHLWGSVHPQLLDEQFLFHRFRGFEKIVSSLPCDKRPVFSTHETIDPSMLKGWELFFAVKNRGL